jgi:hypothetical protein
MKIDATKVLNAPGRLGEQLTPKPCEIEKYIAVVGESGAALVAAVAGK